MTKKKLLQKKRKRVTAKKKKYPLNKKIDKVLGKSFVDEIEYFIKKLTK